MTAKCQINYFKPLENQIDEILLPIKGNFRREFVKSSIENEGIESVPPAWLNHNLSSVLSNFLQAQHPQARGGEDLPDLFVNEIENRTSHLHEHYPQRGCKPKSLAHK